MTSETERPKPKRDPLVGRILSGGDALRAIVGAKNREFKAPKPKAPPTDIADKLDWAADGADEIDLDGAGLRGGSKLLRDAAAEIRRLRTVIAGA